MSIWIKRILKARPGAKVAIIGADSYSNINWGNEAPIPEAELVAKDVEIQEEENTAIARFQEVSQAKANARADTFVQRFVNMTPAQLIAYVNDNVSNLSDAKQLLTKLALMLLAIAKEQYK